MTVQHNNLCFVGLPKNAECIELDIDPKEDWYKLEFTLENIDEESGFWGEDIGYDIELPPGNWELIGIYPGLSEEKAALCVEKANDEMIDIGNCHWKDYTASNWEQDKSTALESLSTLMDHLKLYTVNPYGEKPSEPVKYTGKNFFEYGMAYSSEIERWQEAQCHTFDAFAILKRNK